MRQNIAAIHSSAAGDRNRYMFISECKCIIPIHEVCPKVQMTLKNK